MFSHARKGHVEPLGKGCNPSVRTPELLQNAASGGVRERAEGGVETNGILNHTVQYMPATSAAQVGRPVGATTRGPYVTRMMKTSLDVAAVIAMRDMRRHGSGSRDAHVPFSGHCAARARGARPPAGERRSGALDGRGPRRAGRLERRVRNGERQCETPPRWPAPSSRPPPSASRCSPIWCCASPIAASSTSTGRCSTCSRSPARPGPACPKHHGPNGSLTRHRAPELGRRHASSPVRPGHGLRVLRRKLPLSPEGARAGHRTTPRRARGA